MKQVLLLLSLFVFVLSCKKKEDVTPTTDQPQKATTNKNYYTFKVEVVSEADVQIKYIVSKSDPTIKNTNGAYSLKEPSPTNLPQKTFVIEDTILKRNSLSTGAYNKNVTDPNIISYKIYVDGVLRYETKSNHIVYDISEGAIK